MRKTVNSLAMALLAGSMLIGGAGVASASDAGFDEDEQTITQSSSNACGNDVATSEIWVIGDGKAEAVVTGSASDDTSCSNSSSASNEDNDDVDIDINKGKKHDKKHDDKKHDDKKQDDKKHDGKKDDKKHDDKK
ncbi:Translation initiation factor 2 [Carbonactinospora thermoautotrophica]|uniref:Translation initiation factor 2 n=2 Tax=Carbonactinospora thermoautotrophica TaxID=1469144 RepID=A0A132MVZ6_9ACTN|nr:hypothetical protein [Carbonactinospora thermoautotrophica]KWX01984.1 Translation initiation factor 2 [Carbonactinospora thermoautotrophica]